MPCGANRVLIACCITFTYAYRTYDRDCEALPEMMLKNETSFTRCEGYHLNFSRCANPDFRLPEMLMDVLEAELLQKQAQVLSI